MYCLHDTPCFFPFEIKSTLKKTPRSCEGKSGSSVVYPQSVPATPEQILAGTIKVNRRHWILANGTSFPLSALCQETLWLLTTTRWWVAWGTEGSSQWMHNTRRPGCFLLCCQSSFQIVKCHSNLEHLTLSLRVQLTPGIKVRCIMDPLCVKVKWRFELK